jgi:hypothetical protein
MTREGGNSKAMMVTFNARETDGKGDSEAEGERYCEGKGEAMADTSQ